MLCYEIVKGYHWPMIYGMDFGDWVDIEIKNAEKIVPLIIKIHEFKYLWFKFMSKFCGIW